MGRIIRKAAAPPTRQAPHSEGTPSQEAGVEGSHTSGEGNMSGLKGFPPHSEIERAYVRGLREGMQRSARTLAHKREQINELTIRLRYVKGELIREKKRRE